MFKFILALSLFISTPAFAWSGGDTKREAAFLGLLATDCNQTMQQAKNGWANFTEQNPILGDKPSVNRVRNYCLASAVTHYAIARTLDDKWRKRFQNVTIGIEVGAVGRWIHYGVGIKF